MTTRRGPVERKARSDVRKLGALTGVQASLAETAFTLARMLDDGAGLATAAVARELRAHMTELARQKPAKPQEDSLAQRRARRAAAAGG